MYVQQINNVQTSWKDNTTGAFAVAPLGHKSLSNIISRLCTPTLNLFDVRYLNGHLYANPIVLEPSFSNFSEPW